MLLVYGDEFSASQHLQEHIQVTRIALVSSLIQAVIGPVCGWERCRISPPHFLAKCLKR